MHAEPIFIVYLLKGVWGGGGEFYTVSCSDSLCLVKQIACVTEGSFSSSKAGTLYCCGSDLLCFCIGHCQGENGTGKNTRLKM